MKRTYWTIIPIVLALLAATILLRVGMLWADQVDTLSPPLALALALLFPIGLTLIAWSTLPPDQNRRVATLATLALALALIGYLASGFGLHFGSVASVSDNAGLQSLSRFFSLVQGDDSAHWGFFGLEGFFLSGDAATPAAAQLFVSQLPLVTAITLLVLLALPRRTPPPAQVLAGLTVSAVTYPLAGHWVISGWLAHLGHTLNLGHGTVDFAGAGTIFVVGGATALAASLTFAPRSSDEASTTPVVHFPLLAGLGALLAAVGWIALGPVNPLYAEMGEALNWPLVALNGLAGLAGGTLTAQLFSWFSTGRFDPLMGPRGALSGLIAASAGAPFMPTWAALAVGAVAGLLLPLALYAIKRTLRLPEASAAVSALGLSGFWGLLAVALFADGRWGQGWNGVAGLAGQGVSGLLVAPGLQSDGGQLGAQLWGGVALFTLGFVVPWGFFRLLTGLFALLSRLRKWLPRRAEAPTPPSTLGEEQRTPGGFDRVVNVDDRG